VGGVEYGHTKPLQHGGVVTTEHTMREREATKWYYVHISLDGGSMVIGTGIRKKVRVKAGRILDWELVTDAVGSMVIDLWHGTYTDLPLTNANSITGAAPITLTAAQKNRDRVLVGWKRQLKDNDWLYVNVDSCTVIKTADLSLRVER
jgi:hypothetical protein